jgi:hypothetical protein
LYYFCGVDHGNWPKFKPISRERTVKLSSNQHKIVTVNYFSPLRTVAQDLIRSTANTKIDKEPRIAGITYTSL